MKESMHDRARRSELIVWDLVAFFWLTRLVAVFLFVKYEKPTEAIMLLHWYAQALAIVLVSVRMIFTKYRVWTERPIRDFSFAAIGFLMLYVLVKMFRSDAFEYNKDNIYGYMVLASIVDIYIARLCVIPKLLMQRN